jgi:uncharacterized protein (TIGR03066 family)
MRPILGCGLAFALVMWTGTSVLAAADPDAAKLPGKWQLAGKDLPEGVKVVAEFVKEGKLTVTIDVDGKTEVKSGTYKLAGDKLTVTIEGEEAKTSTVLKLTDDALEFKNSTGKTMMFSRVKPK